MSTPVPHFELTADLIKAISNAEAKATVEALEEASLLRAPYSEFTLSFAPEHFFREWWGLSYDPSFVDVTFTIHILDAGMFRTLTTSSKLLVERADGWDVRDICKWSKEAQDQLQWLLSSAMCLLVSALATKNTVVRTSYNKRAARGHGSGHFRAANGVIRLSRTVVDAPPCVVNSTGRRMPRHLRRGHIHRFWKGGALVPKFIPPVWVNDAVGTPAKKPVYSVVA